MTAAFWDSSALVPLCVEQKASAAARRLTRQHPMVVWWATPVEMRSAFARLARMGALRPAQLKGAEKRLDLLRRGWREMQPSEALRAEAMSLLARFPLKSADALQLAAATVWTLGNPAGRVFLSGDLHLLEAAKRLRFDAVEI
ncbi:MAG TPA: type II toxin-antitoxin system VapC family toxin [Acidobacteriaceae bacterium]